MKHKAPVLVLFGLALTLPAVSPLEAQHVGGGAGIIVDTKKTEVDGTDLNGDYTQETTENLTSVDGGAFLSFPWLQVSVSYQKVLQGNWEQDKNYKKKTETTSDSYDSLEASALYLSLLGKYPLEKGQFTIWPGAGIAYENAIVIKGEDSNVDISDEDNNNWYLQLGGGTDFEIHSSWIIQPSILLRINLTTDKDKETKVKEKYDLGIIMGLRLGYRL